VCVCVCVCVCVGACVDSVCVCRVARSCSHLMREITKLNGRKSLS